MQIKNEAGSVSLNAAVIQTVSQDDYTVSVSATGLTHEGKQVTVYLTFANEEIETLAHAASIV